MNRDYSMPEDFPGFDYSEADYRANEADFARKDIPTVPIEATPELIHAISAAEKLLSRSPVAGMDEHRLQLLHLNVLLGAARIRSAA